VTPAKCVSCAAQNAALVDLPLSLQVVGVEKLARESPRGHRFIHHLFRL